MPLGAADSPLPAPDARLPVQTGARRIGAIAAVLLALATAMGALESHLLRSHFTAEQDAIFKTALQYQFLQSLGLLALAALLQRADSSLLRWAARLLCAGIVLFSGSL